MRNHEALLYHSVARRPNRKNKNRISKIRMYDACVILNMNLNMNRIKTKWK